MSAVSPSITSVPLVSAPLSLSAPRSQGAIYAQNMLNARIRDTSKSTYNSKLKRIRNWLSQNGYNEYIEEKSFRVPLPPSVVTQFFGDLTEAAQLLPINNKRKAPDSRDDTNSNSNSVESDPTLAERPQKRRRRGGPLSVSYVRGCKSALVWQYSNHRIQLDSALDLELEGILQGYMRKVASLKQSGQMDLQEGKEALSFIAYRMIAHKLAIFVDARNSTIASCFAWTFFVLQWNMIARSESVTAILLQHICWTQDSLVIYVPKHKADQEGKCGDQPVHIYANPLQPCVCPVLALAVHIFSTAQRSTPQLFQGELQNKRYCKLLARVLSGLDPSEVQQFGSRLTAEDIGTHSNRKGAASYCFSMAGGPSSVHVLLRAKWSLGPTQNRYIFQGDGGDQVTGRVLSGLPYHNREFATLPPHFASDQLSQWTDQDWSIIVPSYPTMPVCFKQTLPYLLASVIYHEPWLRATLPNHHPIFSSMLLASNFIVQYDLRDKVLTGEGRCPVTGLLATGIPPHLAIVNQMVEESQKSLRQGTEIKTAVDQSREWMTTQLAHVVAKQVLEQCEVNGAVSVTRTDIESMLDSWMGRMDGKLQKISQTTITTEGDSTGSDHSIPPTSPWRTWTWGGGIRHVPKGWELPRNHVKELWFLWHFGHVSDRIAPYYLLHPCDMSNKKQRKQLSRTRGLMDVLSRLSKPYRNGKKLKELSRQEHSELFDKAFAEFCRRLQRTDTRVGDVSVGRLYNLIRNNASKFTQ